MRNTNFNEPQEIRVYSSKWESFYKWVIGGMGALIILLISLYIDHSEKSFEELKRGQRQIIESVIPLKDKTDNLQSEVDKINKDFKELDDRLDKHLTEK